MFDINTADDLYFHVCKTMESFSQNNAKKVSDLFFLLMALNHLREWIAPRYCKRNNKWPEPKNNAELFSRNIYDIPEFDTLRKLCNGTKHLRKNTPKTSASYGLSIDEWNNINDVKSFDNGPPSQFEVNGKDVEELISTVLNYYSENWFNKPVSNK